MVHAQATQRQRHLPDGWIESYYEVEQLDVHPDAYQITAVYEHPETDLKVYMIPGGGFDTELGLPSHEVGYIKPVYARVGIVPHFDTQIDRLEPYFRGIKPEAYPRNSSDVPNINPAPRDVSDDFATFDDGGEEMNRYDYGPSFVKWMEPNFEYSEQLPQAAVESMDTINRRPYDYTGIIDSINLVWTVERIAADTPELFDDPYPIDLYVSYSDREDRNYIDPEIALAGDKRDELLQYINVDAIQEYTPENDVKIGTAWYNLPEEGAERPSVTLESIEFDVPARKLKTVRGRLKRMYSV